MAAGKVTDSNFATEVENSNVPVLVDCWAEWCAPCRMVGPTIDKIADAYQGKAKVVKLNVDENQQTAAKYGIQSIPTLLIFENGKVVDGLVGAHPEGNIKQKLDQYVK